MPQGAKGQTRDKAAAFTGMAGRTLDKADAIVKAAEAEPEKFGKLVEDMDRTGPQASAYRDFPREILGAFALRRPVQKSQNRH